MGKKGKQKSLRNAQFLQQCKKQNEKIVAERKDIAKKDTVDVLEKDVVPVKIEKTVSVSDKEVLNEQSGEESEANWDDSDYEFSPIKGSEHILPEVSEPKEDLEPKEVPEPNEVPDRRKKSFEESKFDNVGQPVTFEMTCGELDSPLLLEGINNLYLFLEEQKTLQGQLSTLERSFKTIGILDPVFEVIFYLYEKNGWEGRQTNEQKVSIYKLALDALQSKSAKWTMSKAFDPNKYPSTHKTFLSFCPGYGKTNLSLFSGIIEGYIHYLRNEKKGKKSTTSYPIIFVGEEQNAKQQSDVCMELVELLNQLGIPTLFTQIEHQREFVRTLKQDTTEILHIIWVNSTKYANALYYMKFDEAYKAKKVDLFYSEFHRLVAHLKRIKHLKEDILEKDYTMGNLMKLFVEKPLDHFFDGISAEQSSFWDKTIAKGKPLFMGTVIYDEYFGKEFQRLIDSKLAYASRLIKVQREIWLDGTPQTSSKVERLKDDNVKVYERTEKCKAHFRNVHKPKTMNDSMEQIYELLEFVSSMEGQNVAFVPISNKDVFQEVMNLSLQEIMNYETYDALSTKDKESAKIKLIVKHIHFGKGGGIRGINLPTVNIVYLTELSGRYNPRMQAFTRMSPQDGHQTLKRAGRSDTNQQNSIYICHGQQLEILWKAFGADQLGPKAWLDVNPCAIEPASLMA